MKTVRRLAVILCFCAGQLPAQITGLQSGIVCPPEPSGFRDAPGTISGQTHLLDSEPPFVSTDNRVPAVLGVGFGVKTRASPGSGIDVVQIRVTHPPMGTERVREQRFLSVIGAEETAFVFFQFDYPYELVTGDWRIAAYDGDRMLFDETFVVVDPDQVPQLADICDFRDLLS